VPLNEKGRLHLYSPIQSGVPSYLSQAQILLGIASSALSRFYDVERGLFHFELSAKGGSPVLQVIDDVASYSTAERYFLITAIGVFAYRMRRGDLELGFDFDGAWERLLVRIETIRYPVIWVFSFGLLHLEETVLLME